MNAYPEPNFAHLVRLSDDTGLFEHAQRSTPRRHHGYCLDDVTRGLVVICREPAPTPELMRIAERYLAFVLHAQDAHQGFRNRLGYDRRWQDEPSTGDWWGRAVWALGTVVARCPDRQMRELAADCFDVALACRSRWPRAMAFAALGAGELLSAQPHHTGARRLLADATIIGAAGVDPNWLWPEPKLTYANALLPEALIVAGTHLKRPAATAKGLRLLSWLIEREIRDGRVSPAPVGGWALGQRRPGFDQQPIEVATIADACATAFAVTGDARWAEALHLTARWFLGENDTGIAMYDPETGGGYDGLTATGRNVNQGAESTLAALATLQHARTLSAAGPNGVVPATASAVADPATVTP